MGGRFVLRKRRPSQINAATARVQGMIVATTRSTMTPWVAKTIQAKTTIRQPGSAASPNKINESMRFQRVAS